MTEKDDLQGMSAWPFERQCPECKKKFCVPNAETWAYRSHGNLVCSWGCMRKREKRAMLKEEEALAKRRKKLTPRQKEGLIRKMVLDGMNNEEINRETGVSVQLVNYYRRKIEGEYPDAEEV